MAETGGINVSENASSLKIDSVNVIEISYFMKGIQEQLKSLAKRGLSREFNFTKFDSV